MNICGNITFIGNGAGEEGGGLSAGTDSNVNIIANTTFIGNSANNGGGVSAGLNSNVNIVEVPLSLTTQLEQMVEESVQGTIAIYTSVETPFLLVTQLK